MLIATGSRDRPLGVEERAAAELQLLGRRDPLQDEPVALRVELLDAPAAPRERTADETRPDDRDQCEVDGHRDRDDRAREHQPERDSSRDGARSRRAQTDDATTPEITWSTEPRTVRSVSEELRSQPQELWRMRVPDQQA